MTDQVVWSRVWYGWHAYVAGNNLTVRKYTTGPKPGYVARVNQSAATSPAKAWSSLDDAKADAIRTLAALSRC